MLKWFKDLVIGDIIANSRLKVGRNDLCYFDEEDCDYLQINQIKKGIIYTMNLQTKQPMELWCGETFDEFIKQPCFKIVDKPKKIDFIEIPKIDKPIQLTLFDMI